MEPTETIEERLIYLFRGYEHKILSDEEKDELQAWVQSSLQHKQLFTDLSNREYRETALQKQQSYDVENALLRVKTQIKPLHRSYFYKYTAIAACLILISLSIFYFYGDQLTKSYHQQQIAKNDLKPGGNKATLRLADGTIVDLDSIATGPIAEQAGINISKTKDGQLIYTVKDNGQYEIKGNNTITTPAGGQYQVILPDGSIVWLNASSSLNYPISFAAYKNRTITLNGEAYFEVSHNKTKPFIVKTAKQDVEVLGTHFNINAYADETTVRTTLLEGSVKVKSNLLAVQGSNTILNPGEQSILLGNTISVTQANTEEAIAWKNGYFMFNNETLESIMRKVSRWYDVKVEFEDETLKKKVFSGTISRFGNVSQVIDKLELTESVHFGLKERRITVMR